VAPPADLRSRQDKEIMRLAGKDQVMAVFGQELTLPKHKHPFATRL
jgi:hypothetical protein